MKRKCNKLWGIAILLILQMVLLIFVVRLKNQTETPTSEYLDSFGVEVSTETRDFACLIRWWQKENSQENEYYLTLPYFAQNRSVKVNFVSGSDVFLDGEKLKNGMTLSKLEEGVHEIACADRDYRLCVIYGSDIPTVHITTDTGTMEHIYADKHYKESGFATILNTDAVEYQGNLDYITIRGNYTSTLAKKPFNIKFLGEADLFDMGASKKWCLLANYLDNTMIKDKIGYDFADEVGLTFSPESILTDLYINGEYIGNYTLCERIEISESRININDLGEWNERLNQEIDFETLELGGVRGDESYLELGSSMWVNIPNTPEPSKGAYLIEYELASRYDDEVSGFISNYGQPIIVKSPEYASQEQVQYIQQYYQAFEDAVLSDNGYNAQGKHYSDYIDVESYAKLYVFQEFIKNLDAAGTSLFFYKEEGKKLVAGPVWDVDLGFGYPIERDGVNMADPNSLWVAGGHLSNELSDKCSVFTLLCKHEDFRMEATKQWKKYFIPRVDAMLNNVSQIYEESRESIILDKFKWNSDAFYEQVAQSMDGNISTMGDFISQRADFLTNTFFSEKWKSSNYLPYY